MKKLHRLFLCPNNKRKVAKTGHCLCLLLRKINAINVVCTNLHKIGKSLHKSAVQEALQQPRLGKQGLVKHNVSNLARLVGLLRECQRRALMSFCESLVRKDKWLEAWPQRWVKVMQDDCLPPTHNSGYTAPLCCSAGGLLTTA